MRSTKPKYQASKIILYSKEAVTVSVQSRAMTKLRYVYCLHSQFLTNACSVSDNQNKILEMVDISGRDYGKFEYVKVGIQIMKIMLFSWKFRTLCAVLEMDKVSGSDCRNSTSPKQVFTTSKACYVFMSNFRNLRLAERSFGSQGSRTGQSFVELSNKMYCRIWLVLRVQKFELKIREKRTTQLQRHSTLTNTIQQTIHSQFASVR